MSFVWFPALSVGAWTSISKKDPGVRFYNKETTTSFFYPYILYSAGHLYKKEDYANIMGFNLKKGLYFGDSGGYQIATGQLKNTPEIRKDIFDWLEKNTNIAANLDIPPYVTNQKVSGNVFNECLEMSYNNFKFFSDNRSGSTNYLNCLQGRDIRSWEIWYEKVKDFKFYGWGIGSVGIDVSLSLQTLFFLLSKGEMEKAHNKIFHIFGTSRADAFIYMIYFAKMLELKRGLKVLVTSDSSSANKNAAFGGYYTAHKDFSSFSFLRYTNTIKAEDINQDAKLPCNCKICEKITLRDIYKWDSMAYGHLLLHNTLFFINFITAIKNIMDCNHNQMILDSFPAKISNNLKIIEQAFEVSNPTEFLRHRGTTFEDNTAVSNISNEFF